MAIGTTTKKFGVVTKLSGLCDEKAVKEQRSAKAYSKYVQDMDTDGKMAIVPDDRQNTRTGLCQWRRVELCKPRTVVRLSTGV